MESQTRQNKKDYPFQAKDGLDMRDFSLFDKVLELNWVKRLCSNSDTPWQYIPKSLLADVGGTELFKCNYDYNLLDLDNHLPPFYREIIFLLAGHRNGHT